jgi:hypothetical protein
MPTPEIGAGRMSWHDNVMRNFDEFAKYDQFARNTPEETRDAISNFILKNRDKAAESYDDGINVLRRDVQNYFDKVRTNNPNMSLPEQLSIMQSQTELPIEFLNAILRSGAPNVIRQEKPVAEMVAPATAGQFPWRDDVLKWFESHEGTPHGSNKSYVANRALNYGDDASSWVKDFKKYYDEFSASNPNVPVAEQISTMQSQTGLPAEFVEAIFNRMP